MLKSVLVGLVLALVAGAGGDSDFTPSPTSSLLLKRLEESQHSMQGSPEEPSTTQATAKQPKPEMYSLRVTSRIEYRFANTLISSRLANPATTAQEVFFSVVLPETAFISKFLMEVGGKVYEAYVREKEEAKKEYDQAVGAGLGAAHIALSARDSNRFTVSVNIEPLAKVTFNLTYEELLTRRLGAYNHVINLDPGQVVREMRVDVFIKESRNITTLRVPELRSGNQVDANELTKANPLATIDRSSPTEAHVSFAPTAEEQKALGKVKPVDGDSDADEGHHKVTEGLGGQFVVQYDVNRDPQAGEVLVNNGYFVHFFSPTTLPPLRKHALFVLDVSGSMEGRKIDQLKEAMTAILDDLQEGDYFNIIEFSYSVTVWNLDSTAASAVFSPYNAYSYDAPAPNPGPTPAFPATPEYVAKAKEIVKKMRAGGGTNIYDTLKTVLRVAHSGLENISSSNDSSTREPIIVFLTDGEPTVGETRLAKIFSVVSELNHGPQAAIFSLAFGDDADLGFLKKLSLQNAGFARKIYEASDAALQLRDFYRQIASPLLANVTFNYVPDKVVAEATTKAVFHTLFAGSELVVAGKLRANPNTTSLFDSLDGDVTGVSSTGESTMLLPQQIDLEPEPPSASRPVTSLERLWAYLTIQQLLERNDERGGEEGEAANDTLTPKKEALELALKYSFVTPLTSLVVVKPNETKTGGPETVDPVGSDASNKYGGFSGSFGPVDRLGAAGVPLPLSSGPSSLSWGAGGAGGASGAAYSPALVRPIAVAEEAEEDAYVDEEHSYESADKQLSTTTHPGVELGGPGEKEAVVGVLALVDMSALSWLAGVLSGSDVMLPFGVNQSDVVYHLQQGSELNATSTPAACVTLSGAPGTCLHLQNCSLNAFQHDIAVYRTYFCSIDKYAGACCPDEVTTRGSHEPTSAVDQQVTQPSTSDRAATTDAASSTVSSHVTEPPSVSAVTSSVSAVTSSVSAVTSSVSAVTSSPAASPVTEPPSVSAVTSSVSAVTTSPASSHVTEPPSVSAVTSSVSAVTSSVSAVTSSISAVTSSPAASPVTEPPSVSAVVSSPPSSHVTAPPSVSGVTSEMS